MWIALLFWTFYLLVAGIVLLAAIFCLEVLVTLVPWPETTRVEPLSRLSFAVLIPAHNAQTVLGRTLQVLIPTLGPKDRVIVVADNCTDGTLVVARQAGAEVVERRDPKNQGKAFAIDQGLKYLERQPPDAVIFLDPDCLVQPETVRLLGTAALTMKRPAQAMNYYHSDSAGGTTRAAAALAFWFKNLVRAIGLARLTGACHFSTSGVAIPWSMRARFRVADGDQVDDLQLEIDLALSGNPPLLLTYARIDSPPLELDSCMAADAEKQPGYWRSLATHVPKLLAAATAGRRPDLMGLALDLALPPLSLLLQVWIVTLLAALAIVPLGGSGWPALFLLAGGLWLLFSLLAGWFLHCRRQIPLSALLACMPFVLRLAGRRDAAWARHGA
jgi:hypothetical protein